jgi:hypothetical protein
MASTANATADQAEVISRPPAPPLPATVTDLLAQRKMMRSRSINDDVDEIHLKLWEQESYRRLFTPIYREETIEGSFIADDMVAAMKVREFASKNEQFSIARSARLAAIVKALHIVARRYGISRQERQRLVGGERVNGGITEE